MEMFESLICYWYESALTFHPPAQREGRIPARREPGEGFFTESINDDLLDPISPLRAREPDSPGGRVNAKTYQASSVTNIFMSPGISPAS